MKIIKIENIRTLDGITLTFNHIGDDLYRATFYHSEFWNYHFEQILKSVSKEYPNAHGFQFSVFGSAQGICVGIAFSLNDFN